MEDTHQNSDHFVLFPQSTKQWQHWICVADNIWTFTPHFFFLLHWEYGVKKVATVLQHHLVYVFVTKTGCLYHMQQVTYTSKQNAGPRGRLLGSRSDHVYAGQFTPFRRVVTMIMSTLLQHFEQKSLLIRINQHVFGDRELIDGQCSTLVEWYFSLPQASWKVHLQPHWQNVVTDKLFTNH